MPLQAEPAAPSRLVFFGEAVLADGFGLIGFETHPDADPEALEEFLDELIRRRESAFIIIDANVAENGGPILSRVRAEAGRIVIVEVPRLNEPHRFETGLDERIHAIFSAEMGQRQPT